jgi:hypothetical protein
VVAVELIPVPLALVELVEHLQQEELVVEVVQVHACNLKEQQMPVEMEHKIQAVAAVVRQHTTLTPLLLVEMVDRES